MILDGLEDEERSLSPEEVKAILDECDAIEARGGPKTAKEANQLLLRSWIESQYQDAIKPTFFDKFSKGGNQ